MSYEPPGDRRLRRFRRPSARGPTRGRAAGPSGPRPVASTGLDSDSEAARAIRLYRSARGRPMQIPLFPLHTVLCPGIVLPLHIFEDRYRALTRHCLDNGAPFGVVLIREGLEAGPGRTLALAGCRGSGRDPRGGPLSGRPLRPAGGGDGPVRHRCRRSRSRALPGRRRHAARGRDRRRGARRTIGRLGHPPVRPLSRADARSRRRDDRSARHPCRGRREPIRR